MDGKSAPQVFHVFFPVSLFSQRSRRLDFELGSGQARKVSENPSPHDSPKLLGGDDNACMIARQVQIIPPRMTPGEILAMEHLAPAVGPHGRWQMPCSRP